MKDTVLHAIIKDELASLERMLVILREEQDTLTRARIDHLSDITEQKNRAIAELERLSAERRTLMAARNIPDDGSAISAWLETHEPSLLETWETLIALARQASQYNQSNSQLLNSREEANRALMGLLISEHEIENSYTADGRLSHTTSRRPLDRA